MDHKKLVELGRSSITGKLPSGVTPGQYSKMDVATAFAGELAKGIETPNQYIARAPHMMDLLQEVYSPILPKEVLSQFGEFANVKFINHGDKATFQKRVGHMRGKTFVTKVGLGGRFESFRLDQKEFSVDTFAIGGAARMDWERFLAGQENLAEYTGILMEGMQDEIYRYVAGMLIDSKNSIRPDNTKAIASGFDAAKFNKLLTTVSYYGPPVIFATRAFIDEMPPTSLSVTEGTTTQILISNDDMSDIRNTGRLQRYKNAPIIELPQSFTDENNLETVLEDQYAFIMPGGDKKVVNLVFEGDMQFRHFENRDFSFEVATYQKIGGAIMHLNNWAIYQNTNLAK